MKLQQLTIHNIASIEDAVIDFEAQPLADAEVFLITGKTGAGKSTLLDAICLALFADTPRLDNTKMQGDTRDGDKTLQINDPRQLMRRNTGECRVSLTFCGSNDVHYMASWSVTRARKNPTGNMQPKQWELKNLDTGLTLSKDKEIEAEISVAIGLDFKQFCRTTMLAQGEFTRFLNSKDDEKAEILEKITGVDSYSRIGAAVFAITGRKKQEWEEAQRQIEGLRLLNEEELATRNEALQALETQYSEQRKRQEQATEARQWLTSLTQAEADEKGQNDKLTQLALRYAELLHRPKGDTLTVAAAHALLSDWKELFENVEKEQNNREQQLAEMHLNDLRKQRDLLKEQQTAVRTAAERITRLQQEEVRRTREKQDLDDAEDVLNKKKKERSDVALQEARKIMEQRKQELDRQRDTVDKFAKAMRQRLQVGDECPVCRQRIASALPREEELEALVAGLQQAFDNAEHAWQTEQQKQQRLEAEIQAETRSIATRKRAYEQDNRLHEAQTLVQASAALLQVSEADLLRPDTLTARSAALEKETTALNSRIEQGEAAEKEVQQQRAQLEQKRQTLQALFRQADELGRQVTTAMAQRDVALQRQTEAAAHLALFRQEHPTFSDERPQLQAQLQQDIAERERLINGLNEQRGAIMQELKTDAENRQSRGQLVLQAEQRKEVYQRWSRLNQLIGDATGNKFRKIAQSYVLSSLIHSANTYMQTLTDRYRLCVTPGTFVITLEDAWQGYVSRAASTLSGGESFLVSLALALALSDMGQRLAVDTLFIDEGFGTLSGEPLQNAISTLRSLHRHAGRKVGIISHVEELQERIPVQIRVEQDGDHSAGRVRVI